MGKITLRLLPLCPTASFLLFCAAASAQLRITTSSVPAANQYQGYSTVLTATGGTSPYRWSVVSSTGVSLPEGMNLNPTTGLVSATQVNGQGGYTVTVQVTDSGSPSASVATAAIDFGVNSDGSLGGCQMFPADSIYNQRIDRLPVDTTASHQIPAGYLSSPIHPDFGHGFYPSPGGIPYMRVPANQPTTNVFLGSSGQIDSAGTYAWPFLPWPDAAIETTSFGFDGDDHHILVLQTSVNNINGPQTGPCILYETYQNTAVQSMFNAATNTWNMSAGVHYALNSNEIAASTSTLDNGAQDSPGIPMVPLLIRYSEVPLGVQHPLRISFPSPTNGWVWPGTGCCGGSGPPQGLLYRLKAGVNWQAACPVSTNPQAATVLQALQQYGAYMSDHGGTGFVGGAPDVRWSDDDLACIKKFHVSDLEVVDNSSLEISPLSGQTMPYVIPSALPAATVGTAYSTTFSAVGGSPASRQWTVASGSLPPGLLFDATTGTASGTPVSSAGSPYGFTITVLDTASGYSSKAQAFSIGVSGGSATTSITVTSVPAGRSITVDGAAFTAPQTFNWVAGTSHTVSANSPQGTGTRYVFARWSDNGAQSHSITAPAASTTYTASFTTQYLLTTGVSPAGGGNVTASPASADGYYNSGASVQLTAAPANGYAFSTFSGDLTGSTDPGLVSMTAPRSVTALFSVPATFAITKTHGGNFTQGQSRATYAVTVSNPSASARANGIVTVTETVPSGMTLVSMAGTGWICPSAGSSCTRVGSLAAKASYPAITVTVRIATNAGSPLINAVSVSVNGTVSASTSDSTTITSTTSQATASYVGNDSSTAGSWIGRYGLDGYNLIGDAVSAPAYLTVVPQFENNTWYWDYSTTDTRALQRPGSPSNRIAACGYSPGTMNIDLAFKDNNTHQVAIYLLDWDRIGRTETVQILDATNTVLDTRPVSDFSGGQYLVWNVSGHVTLRIVNTNPSTNAVISGLFFR
jgi:hypothetical protein